METIAATYDERVNGSDSGAGKDCDHSLQDHGHVDCHTVSFLDPFALQHVGEPAYFFQQFLVCQSAVIIWMVSFPETKNTGNFSELS